MRKEQYQPQLSDRENRARWQADGSHDAHTRATQVAKEILQEAPTSFIPEPQRGVIKKEITGIRPFIMD